MSEWREEYGELSPERSKLFSIVVSLSICNFFPARFRLSSRGVAFQFGMGPARKKLLEI
jgi:hypothetical protein